MRSARLITYECECNVSPVRFSDHTSRTELVNYRYDFLDSQKQGAQAAKLANPDPEKQFEAALKLRADGLNMESKLPWIYMNDIESVWDQYIVARKR
jgi:hypothetical protein